MYLAELACLAMERKDEILGEIRKLLDEQLAALTKTMSPAEVVGYIERKKQIDELLEEMARNGFSRR